MRRKEGQSILEYVIVLMAILLAVAYYASTTLRGGIGGAFSNMSSAITSATGKIPR